MENYLVWFVLAAALIGLEMLVGSFYLLMYGLACALGGVAALLGLPVVPQLATVAIGGVAGTLWLRRQPINRRTGGDSLDIGQQVKAEQWKSDSQLRIRYRGTTWDAELQVPLADRPDTLYIVGQRSNTFIVAAQPPQQP